ncbi:HIT domain-containing protein [archaeon]|jgi:histidine triad (HIT) family protein|nr:HIT domain-containing protein [archaeon]MBT7129037.1 HIT domain-containing protein [archaeon]
MPITTEEASKIKEQLLTQLDNFPEEKRSQITEQINSMTGEQVEAFVKQNNLTHLGGQCIFCSIVANKTPSYKIAEDKNYIAILELNPLSKGHSLIIPKEHLEKVPESADALTQEIARKLKNKFNPEDVKINELKIMDHALLEVVPIYGNETERHQASEEELKSLQEEILKAQEIKMPEKPQEVKTEEIPILPPRIP